MEVSRGEHVPSEPLDVAAAAGVVTGVGLAVPAPDGPQARHVQLPSVQVEPAVVNVRVVPLGNRYCISYLEIQVAPVPVAEKYQL